MPKLDPLTGLLDGQNLERRLDRMLDRADEAAEPLSLVVLDLGGLRQINDKHGREAGNIVLRVVGQLLADATTEPNICFRLGGDAFVAILPGRDAVAASSWAAGLKDTIASTTAVVSDGAAIALSASSGVSTYPDDAQTSKALVRVADRRMQAAKLAPLAGY